MIVKLPKWAQDHIRGLEQERTIALNTLNQHLDSQTPSKIYYEEYLSTGEGTQNCPTGPTNKRFYVQSRRVEVEHAGILLRVSCHEDSNMHDTGIELQWSVPTGTIDMVAMVPKSFQQVALISHANMRVQAQRKRPPLDIK